MGLKRCPGTDRSPRSAETNTLIHRDAADGSDTDLRCVVRWLMKLFASLGAKVILLTVCAVLVAGGLGGLGWYAMADLRTRIDEMAVVQQALHQQAEVDGANHA